MVAGRREDEIRGEECCECAFTQAQLDEYIRRLEEAERTITAAEAKIAERDRRVAEVERLLDCMGKVSRISVPLMLRNEASR